MIVFLLALFGQGSALGICKRPTMSRRGDKAAPHPTSIPGWHWSPRAPRGDRAAPGLSLAVTPGPGRTCEFSFLGEVGGAGAAGDTDERRRHLGVPAVDIHVTAGHGQLESRGTAGSAARRAGDNDPAQPRWERTAWPGGIVFPSP